MRRVAAILLATAFACALAWYALVPNFVDGKTSALNPIMNNLRQLSGAAEQWALDTQHTGSDIVTRQDVAPYLKHGWVQPAAGEEYRLRTVGESPEAVLQRKVQQYPSGTILRLGSNTAFEVVLPKSVDPTADPPSS